MRILSIASILAVVYFCCAIVGYLSIKQGVGTFWWFIGVGIISIVAGATLATITTTFKIYRREKAHMEIRAMMWHEGKGRD